jgi:hypothetical protein
LDLRTVKTAPGRRLRHPTTQRVLRNHETDPDADGHKVDLDDPHWYKALKRGDIIIVPEKVASAPIAPAQPDAAGESASAAQPEPLPAAAPTASPTTVDLSPFAAPETEDHSDLTDEVH